MSDLNERMQGYRKEPWWPNGLESPHWSDPDNAWRRWRAIRFEGEAHAIIGWDLLKWYVTNEEVDGNELLELLQHDDALDHLLSCYDAIKKGASDE